MVQWQLCTLDHLNVSGFGRPPPRHGLQLLFWFANHCVICELHDSANVMKLVTDCQPEKGVYGFHRFGNLEELLPVLCKPKKNKSKKQLVYFVVGNLNPMTYPESADLPASVKEYYGNDDASNMDRIIISYQVKTRVVEKVYVTEHDDYNFGRFRSDGTHEISPELIRDLQNPQLDLSTFLSQMGYYGDVETIQNSDPEVQLIFSMMQNDPFGFFSEAFSQQVDLNFDPFSFVQQGQYRYDTDRSAGQVTEYGQIQPPNKKTKRNKRPKTLRERYWVPRWERPYTVFDEEEKKGGGSGFSWLKILLGVGAIYLAGKCFSWLMRSSVNESVVWMFPQRTQSYPRTHIMLDYVY